MMPRSDAFDLLRSTFERLGIRYAIGGSWASTAFGDPRFTNDVDIVVEFGEENLAAFLDALPDEFYADEEEAVSALGRGRSFNVIHMPSVLKFDLFPSRAFPLGKEELDRALTLEETGLSKSPALFVTPEDILLAKLHWFRSGREVSEVQWRDIRGVVRGCAAGFDHRYLEYGAAKLDVLDLLRRALSEDSTPDPTMDE